MARTAPNITCSFQPRASPLPAFLRTCRPGAGRRVRQYSLRGGVRAARLTDPPRSYEEAISQAQKATRAALDANKTLLEVEFPAVALDGVSGDSEGQLEMTASMAHILDYVRMFRGGWQGGSAEGAEGTRIFFPDRNEASKATSEVFASSPFPISYLTAPSGLEDLGLGRKENMEGKVKDSDRVFVIAYPYFNVNEMLAVNDLHQSVASKRNIPIVVFNGELDRIRSGYYPGFFYPKLAALAKDFLPAFETAFYLHNFKGRKGGRLFRVYPEPWQVLRATGANGESFECIHTQDTMPTLKQVALDIL